MVSPCQSGGQQEAGGAPLGGGALALPLRHILSRSPPAPAPPPHGGPPTHPRGKQAAARRPSQQEIRVWFSSQPVARWTSQNYNCHIGQVKSEAICSMQCMDSGHCFFRKADKSLPPPPVTLFAVGGGGGGEGATPSPGLEWQGGEASERPQPVTRGGGTHDAND